MNLCGVPSYHRRLLNDNLLVLRCVLVKLLVVVTAVLTAVCSGSTPAQRPFTLMLQCPRRLAGVPPPPPPVRRRQLSLSRRHSRSPPTTLVAAVRRASTPPLGRRRRSLSDCLGACRHKLAMPRSLTDLQRSTALTAVHQQLSISSTSASSFFIVVQLKLHYFDLL